MTIVKKSKKKTLAPRVAKAFSEAATSKTTMENPEKPPTVQFLLTEYNPLVEFWKQADARIETAIDFYLTICALVFPGSGLLYQALQSFQLFILASIGVATVTVAFGFLLVQRITGAQFNKAAELLTAANNNDTAAFNDAHARWYANAHDIAVQMNKMNPQFWPLEETEQMWVEHLDATLEEATAHLSGDFAGEGAAYDLVHDLALEMADFFSNGVMRQFPERFRGSLN